jgi:hypothetical protein
MPSSFSTAAVAIARVGNRSVPPPSVPLKSELAIRPIWHHIQRRVEAHILVAFLGYCLWVCLKQKLKVMAQSITPARALESLRSILMVEVWFSLRDGGHLCLPRITEPEKEQALLLQSLSLATARSTPSTNLPPSSLPTM